MADNTCKACRDNYKVTETQMQRILQTSAFALERRVDMQQYQERLHLCSTCPKLSDGVTCTACGCIIPVVAWLKERACPLPGGGRWGKLADQEPASVATAAE
ncbi:DUF6171 family protein [Paenibacillus brevis]|uniref:Uncharacterized protein n=1 Tax=Paenibacillus brevis TaxID=2841508 RepID=A0ABS6FXG6_9BACL|nr:DUF6171 family protein [Paenibacillus brevis]MBU5673815.1 hypothetical protein [Paenibacillus brevis]